MLSWTETLARLAASPRRKKCAQGWRALLTLSGFVCAFLPLLQVIFLGGFSGRLKKKKKIPPISILPLYGSTNTEVPEVAFVV